MNVFKHLSGTILAMYSLKDLTYMIPQELVRHLSKGLVKQYNNQ